MHDKVFLTVTKTNNEFRHLSERGPDDSRNLFWISLTGVGGGPGPLPP